VQQVSYYYRNRVLIKLDAFPAEIPDEQVEILDHASSPNTSLTYENLKISTDVDDILRCLPDWVRPDIIFSESSIERAHVLGAGNYGIIYKGRYRHGNSVYVIKTKKNYKVFHEWIKLDIVLSL
jgi:hypothetical protein